MCLRSLASVLLRGSSTERRTGTTYAWMFANFEGFSARPVFGRFLGFFFAVLDIRANLRWRLVSKPIYWHVNMIFFALKVGFGSGERTLPNFANLKLAKIRILVLTVGEVISCVLSDFG